MSIPSTNSMNMNAMKAMYLNSHLSLFTSLIHNKDGKYFITKHSSRNQQHQHQALTWSTLSNLNHHLFYRIPKAEVYQVLKETKKIILATDGGAKAFKGSLGFDITDAKHRVLILYCGRAAGHDPLSFRTKASEFLAALRIVILIAEYYKEEPTKSLATNKLITLFTDCLSMVNKLDAMNNYPTTHLKCAMDPKWDLLQTIHRLIDKMKERPELE